ncbi:hypothetical protein Hanom_Chr04g00330281 [Helianthus anomalus]
MPVTKSKSQPSSLSRQSLLSLCYLKSAIYILLVLLLYIVIHACKPCSPTIT